MDLGLEARHLRGEAKQLDAVLRRRLVLQTIERLFAQALQQTVKFDRNLPHQILCLVGGLERGAPDLTATGLAAEIAGNICGRSFGNQIASW